VDNNHNKGENLEETLESLKDKSTSFDLMRMMINKAQELDSANKTKDTPKDKVEKRKSPPVGKRRGSLAEAPVKDK